MNEYEARQQARAERYRERAEAARREAQRRGNSHNIETLRGMAGEPIKVGHHSERRHRRLIEKADNDMRAAHEAEQKAKHYERKAQGVEANRAISSDDPDALQKLRDKLEKLETTHQKMKQANQVMRRKPKNEQTPEKLAELAELLGKSEEKCAKLFEPDPCGRLGFPDYALQNSNAEIKRVRHRIAQMEKAQGQDDEPTQRQAGQGWRIEEHPEDNRLRVIFDEKPDQDTRQLLKTHGFRWSRANCAWQRQLTNSARFDADIVARQLDA